MKARTARGSPSSELVAVVPSIVCRRVARELVFGAVLFRVPWSTAAARCPRRCGCVPSPAPATIGGTVAGGGACPVFAVVRGPWPGVGLEFLGCSEELPPVQNGMGLSS